MLNKYKTWLKKSFIFDKIKENKRYDCILGIRNKKNVKKKGTENESRKHFEQC